MGAPQALTATLWSSIKVTPAQAKAICNKHLTAVFLDWSNVTYNKAIDSGIRQEYQALGVHLLRITDSEFSPTGLQGDLNAVLPLNPDILLVGGTINPSQMASILAPAVAQHKIIVSWGVGGPGMFIGPGKPLSALIAYDWYYLGEQMAQAVHQAYPNGANHLRPGDDPGQPWPGPGSRSDRRGRSQRRAGAPAGRGRPARAGEPGPPAPYP